MNGRLKKNIGFSLMPFAFIFLFEPGYAVLDPLPDFIGYVLLCAAIINLADISPKMQDAYNGFRKGILISILRLISIYLLDKVFVGAEQTVGVLLFAFIFSFAELVILIPTYKNFFEAMLSLGMMHEGTAVYQKRIKTVRVKDSESGEIKKIRTLVGKNLTERAYALTTAFLLTRHLAMALPEFTTLANNSSYDFINILRILSALITLPVCIFWLVRVVRYCAAVKNDSLFIENLSAKYASKVEATPEYFTARMLTTGLYIILISFLIGSDFYVDKINLLPNFVFFAFLLLGAIFLRKYSKHWKYLSIIAVVGIFASVASYVSSVKFHSEYQLSAIRKNIDAYNAFYRMLAYHIAEAVVLILTVVILVIFLWSICKYHTNVSVTDYSKEKKEFKRKYMLRGSVSVLMAAVVGGCRIYFIAVQPFLNISNWIFYYSAMISSTLSIISAVALAMFINYVINEIKYRYSLYL